LDKSIDQIYQEAIQELEAPADRLAIEDVSVRYLGKERLQTSSRPAPGSRQKSQRSQKSARCGLQRGITKTRNGR
jgi:hypothetical protein